MISGSFLCESKTHQLKFESPSNFGNPAKWSDGRLPCSGDKIAFDDNLVRFFFMYTPSYQVEIVPKLIKSVLAAGSACSLFYFICSGCFSLCPNKCNHY